MQRREGERGRGGGDRGRGRQRREPVRERALRIF